MCAASFLLSFSSPVGNERTTNGFDSNVHSISNSFSARIRFTCRVEDLFCPCSVITGQSKKQIDTARRNMTQQSARIARHTDDLDWGSWHCPRPPAYTRMTRPWSSLVWLLTCVLKRPTSPARQETRWSAVNYNDGQPRALSPVASVLMRELTLLRNEETALLYKPISRRRAWRHEIGNSRCLCLCGGQSVTQIQKSPRVPTVPSNGAV